ncbi:MAG: GreA/GreB family elongation factor [Myxococcota bacterium]|nr:GreA/GreB family elongation factor [Myxococcota bacterium]
MSDREYISELGFQKLTGEVEHLLTVERPRVVNQVAAAAAEGDRSENAEYIYGKKRLREIDKRVEFLSKRLDILEVVPQPKGDDKARLLSWVHVEDEDGDVKVFRVVGADETDAKQNWISWKSPVGRSLLGKSVDDEVSIKTPGGTVVYLVVDITNSPAD